MAVVRLRQLFSGGDLGRFFRRLFARLGCFLGAVRGFGCLFLAALGRFRTFARLLAAGSTAWLRAELLGASVEQNDSLGQSDGLWCLVASDRGVDAVVADVRTVATVLDDNRAAFVGVLAQNFAGIGAEAAAFLRVGLLVRDQGDGAIEADGQDIVTVFQIFA